MRFLALVVAAVGLDMDVGHHLAQLIAQSPFNLTSDVMGTGDGEFTIHLDVDIDHAQVAVAACAQVVKGFHAGRLGDDSDDPVFFVIGQ